MRVRVVSTSDYPDWWRAAVRRFYGQEGLATRDEIVSWVKAYGTSMDDDLAASADNDKHWAEVYRRVREGEGEED